MCRTVHFCACHVETLVNIAKQSSIVSRQDEGKPGVKGEDFRRIKPLAAQAGLPAGLVGKKRGKIVGIEVREEPKGAVEVLIRAHIIVQGNLLIFPAKDVSLACIDLT